MSYRDKTCRGFIETTIALQLLGGIIAVVVGKQSRTIADEIGHVFADLLSINQFTLGNSNHF